MAYRFYAKVLLRFERNADEVIERTRPHIKHPLGAFFHKWDTNKAMRRGRLCAILSRSD